MKSEELFKELQFLMSKPALLEAVEAVANYSGTLTATASEIIRQAVMRVGNADAFKQNGQPFVFAAKFYAQTINEILSEYDWRFARQQIANVAKDNAAPVTGYDFRYPVPTLAIKVLRVNGIDASENFGTWEVVGNFIHTNLVTPISIDFIAKPTDGLTGPFPYLNPYSDTAFPAIFIELVVARLAYKLAMALGAGDQAMAAAKEFDFIIQRPALQRETATVADASTSNIIATRTHICKQAIMRLGNLESLKSQPMVFANSFYDHTLEELLSDVPWAFAKKQVALTQPQLNSQPVLPVLASSTMTPGPALGYTKKYTLPTDFIQIIRVNNIDTTENFGQWEIVGGFLHTDIGAPIIVDYTSLVTDVALFPAPFIEALICRLAAKIALPLTADGNIVTAMVQVAAETMQRPSVKNQIEKSAKPRTTSSANTVSEICRQAILRVGSADVFKPYGEPMSIATSLFDQTRNELLADFDWQFAREQKTISVDNNPPTFGYSKRFSIPATTLKVLRVNGVDEDENFGKWEIVGSFLHTDLGTATTIQIETTAIVTDASKFPPVFTNMLTVTLAMKLSQLMESQPAQVVRQ
jgi:hypothetical protein